eukprot:6457884-Amphidinium_carterae.1
MDGPGPQCANRSLHTAWRPISSHAERPESTEPQLGNEPWLWLYKLNVWLVPSCPSLMVPCPSFCRSGLFQAQRWNYSKFCTAQARAAHKQNRKERSKLLKTQDFTRSCDTVLMVTTSEWSTRRHTKTHANNHATLPTI